MNIKAAADSIMSILRRVFQGSQTGEMVLCRGYLKGKDKEECEQIPPDSPKPWWSAEKRVEQMLIDDVKYDIIRDMRKRAPANYSMKVESFSSVRGKFAQSRYSKFESTEFSAAGHKWVLSVNFCGNNKEDDYLSFYLKIVDNLSSDMVIYATYKFFVHDQIRDKYLTIQDLAERRFTAVKAEWDVPNAVGLSTFTDPSNGFLVDDSCIIGVEVYVMEIAHAAGTFEMIKKFHSRSSTWEVQKFSKLKDFLWSHAFSIEGRSWRFKLHPRGVDTETGKSIGLFLHLHDIGCLANGSKLYVNFELCVKNQWEGKDHSLTSELCCFNSSTKGWGYVNFMPLSDLDDSSKGFRVKDKVLIEVDIKDIFLMMAV